MLNLTAVPTLHVRLLLLFVVAFSGLFVWMHTGAAQSTMSARQQQIMLNATNVEGWLTEKEHQEFWAPLLVAIKTDGEMAFFRRMLDRAFGHALNFQLEAWKSVQLSQRVGRITKTPDYDQAKQALISGGMREKDATNAIDEAERMLVAVVNKTAYGHKEGPMYLNEETVEKVLSGLEGSFCRIRRLIDPKWSDSKKEYIYPAARLKILAECPLRLEYDQLTIEGMKVKSVSLTYTASEKQHVIIGFFPLRRRWADPNGALTRTALNSLRGMGVAGVRPIVVDWRGRKSATAQGSVTTSHGTMNAAIRVVEGVKVQGIWSLISASTQSLPDALQLLASIEERTMME